MTSQPKRRWLQFSLRTLLELMFGAACYFGGWQSNEWRHTPPPLRRAKAADFHDEDFTGFFEIKNAEDEKKLRRRLDEKAREWLRNNPPPELPPERTKGGII